MVRTNPQRGPARAGQTAMRTVKHLPLVLAAVALAFACTKSGGGKSAPLSLIYPTTSPTYDACGVITSNVPTYSGGAPTSWTISPALPSGLTLDPVSGVISGTPDALSGATVYTVTGTNSKGFATVDLTIEVQAVAPAGLDYPDLPPELGQGVRSKFAPNLSSGNGSNFTVTNGGLPQGVTLDPATGELDGVPVALESVQFEVTTVDCLGQATSHTFNVDVVPPYARGLIVADSGSGTLNNFWRRQTGGDLIPNGWQYSGSGVSHVRVHPWGTFTFVARGATVAVHPISLASDELGASTTARGVGGNIAALACTPDGRFLYATTSSARLYGWSINADSGVLTPLATAYLATGADPRELALSPDGSTLYVAERGAGTIASYSVDPVDGSLAELADTVASAGVTALSVSPNGDWLYAASATTGTLNGYSIDANTGVLSALSWSPFTLQNSGSVSLSCTPNSSFLYVGSSSFPELEMYSLDVNDGEPTALAPATFTGLDNVAHLAVEPRGTQLYVALADGQLTVLDIAVNGQLSYASVGVHLLGHALADFDFLRGHVPFRQHTEHVYATSIADDGVYEYEYDSNTGTLTDLPFTPYATGGTDPQTVSVHPFAEWVLVTHGNTSGAPAISVHALDSLGLLQPGTSVGSLRQNVGLSLDPSGRRAYLASNNSGSPRVVRYDFNATTGLLNPIATTALSGSLWPPSVHPTGTMMAVPDSGDDSIELFTINPSTGALTLRTSVSTGGTDPFRCVFDASGRFLLTAHTGSTNVSVHEVNLVAGTLTPVTGSPFSTTIHPLVMTLSPDGRSVVIADTATGNWRFFSVDHDPSNVTPDGALVQVGNGNVANTALLRFDASSTRIFWVDNGAGTISVRPVTAPGTIGAPLSSVPIGASITNMELRNRPY